MMSITRSGGLCLPLVACFALAFSASSSGQQNIDIGTAQAANSFQTYPAPYGNNNDGARHQILIRASELTAAGMTTGTIYSVAFNVFAAAGTPLQSFTVSIGTTTVTELGPGWEPGLTPVWGPQTYTESDGWNTHLFDTPFNWDGTSNLIIETCFSNGSNSANAQMYHTATSYNSVLYRQTTNPNVCTSTMGNIQPSQNRPDMRFSWNPPTIPPVAAFTASSTYSCSGVIQFMDASQYDPTGWHWDFGDGDTSIVQDPAHAYLNDGTYTVTLIDTNAYGADTATLQVTINASGAQPIAACIPASPGTVAGFGITEVSFLDVDLTSGDALSEGYADHGCVMDTTLAGGQFSLNVVTGQVTTHNVRAWIDWDNSGSFSAGELVLSANSVLGANTLVDVPSGAVLDTPLRLRVMADYDFSPAPQPCTDLQFGQAEDYAVVVIENPFPPEAAFTAQPLFSCDGSVQFTDASLNSPSGWTWDFGDTTTSSDQDPIHIYTNSGTYTVTLIAINANGSDTLVQTNLVTIDFNGQLIAASCAPQTQSYCCGYGILAFSFGGINSTSPDGVEGYQDRSCGNTATVQEGLGYFWQVTTGDQNPHDTRMWIDLDNSGDFSANELVHAALNTISPTATVTIPAGVIFNTPLRLRLQTDVVGQSVNACDQPLYGQTEDFSVIITPNPNPPTAAFSASPETTCDGIVQFTDLSTNLPTGWSWDFGDTQGSTDQNPLHTYSGIGTYTVTLVATNGNGSDTQVETNLIHVVDPSLCDTALVPGFGADLRTECFGIVTDDGGGSANYSPGESGSITIAPTNAEFVTLTFSQFEFDDSPGNSDLLRIYDGIDILAPLIGEFTGYGLGSLPNGGVITSTGGAITIQQAATPGMITAAGFIADWQCSYTGVEEHGNDPIGNVWPQPATDALTIQLQYTGSDHLKVAVRDALGRTMVERNASASEHTLTFDVSSWSAGCYVLSVTSKEGRSTRTLVVQ